MNIQAVSLPSSSHQISPWPLHTMFPDFTSCSMWRTGLGTSRSPLNTRSSWRTGPVSCPHPPVAPFSSGHVPSRAGSHIRISCSGDAPVVSPYVPAVFCDVPAVLCLHKDTNSRSPVPLGMRPGHMYRTNRPANDHRPRAHFGLMGTYKCHPGVCFFIARVRTRPWASPSHSKLRA